MEGIRRDIVAATQSTHIASIVHVLWVSSGGDSRICRNPVIDRVDASEGIDVYFQIGQSDVRAWLERHGIASSGWVKNLNGGKDGVGINSGTTAASIGSVITAGGIFVGLNVQSAS